MLIEIILFEIIVIGATVFLVVNPRSKTWKKGSKSAIIAVAAFFALVDPVAVFFSSHTSASTQSASPSPSSSSPSPSPSPSSSSPSNSSSPSSSPSPSPSPSPSTAPIVNPTLTVVSTGWNSGLDPYAWVVGKDATTSTITLLRVKARFLDTSTDQVIGTDEEYVAGGADGFTGSGTLSPGESSSQIELNVVTSGSISSLLKQVSNKVIAELYWSEQNTGGWHTWETVSLPNVPPSPSPSPSPSL